MTSPIRTYHSAGNRAQSVSYSTNPLQTIRRKARQAQALNLETSLPTFFHF